jgi:hypothetical protein
MANKRMHSDRWGTAPMKGVSSLAHALGVTTSLSLAPRPLMRNVSRQGITGS